MALNGHDPWRLVYAMTDQIKQDINALVERPSAQRTLPPVELVGGFESQRGYAAYQSSGGGGGTGGIASPLTETDASTRTYHTDSLILSGDMLFGMMLHPVASIFMKDANGSGVELRFDIPPEN